MILILTIPMIQYSRILVNCFLEFFKKKFGGFTQGPNSVHDDVPDSCLISVSPYNIRRCVMLKQNTLMVSILCKLHDFFSAAPLVSQTNVQKFIITSQKGVKSFSCRLTMMLTGLAGYCRIWQNESDNYGQLFSEDI